MTSPIETEADHLRFAAFSDLVRSRRSNLLVDPERAVPDELLDQLCQLAQWAPNHKRTWPARFAAFVGEGRSKLGLAFVSDVLTDAEQNNAAPPDEAKLHKTATKYLRAPTVLVVGSAPHANPELHDENRDTVAAAIQTLCLGAEALGLASFWSSPPTRRAPETLELCGFEADTQIVGVVYLGWPRQAQPVIARPTATIRVID